MQSLVESHAADFGEVFAVADSVEGAEGGVPRGAAVRLWRAVDRLAEAGAPAPLLACAQTMGLTLFRLQVAQACRSAEDDISALKREIGSLGREWLGQLPMALSR